MKALMNAGSQLPKIVDAIVVAHAVHMVNLVAGLHKVMRMGGVPCKVASLDAPTVPVTESGRMCSRGGRGEGDAHVPLDEPLTTAPVWVPRAALYAEFPSSCDSAKRHLSVASLKAGALAAGIVAVGVAGGVSSLRDRRDHGSAAARAGDFWKSVDLTLSLLSIPSLPFGGGQCHTGDIVAHRPDESRLLRPAKVVV